MRKNKAVDYNTIKMIFFKEILINELCGSLIFVHYFISLFLTPSFYITMESFI